MAFIEDLNKANIWDKMCHISLNEMKTVRLMSRIDTKYVTHRNLLMPILERAVEEHYMVQFMKSSLNGYDTTYYDTKSLSMYIMHHNRKLHRLKVRCRTYTDSDTSFLELKDKNNNGRTDKHRIQVYDTDVESLRHDKNVIDFIRNRSNYDFLNLYPVLKTDFHRITLVNPQKTERITIDLNLMFTNLITGKYADLKDLIIIELKEDGRFLSTMSLILRDLRVKPFHLSKYCIGMAMTNSNVKNNRFKRKLHLINKIRNDYEQFS